MQLFLQIISISNVTCLEHCAAFANHKRQDWTVLVTAGTLHIYVGFPIHKHPYITQL